MKISIDLDGTLLDHPEFFRELVRLFRDAGHTVGVLTGHRHDRMEKDLSSLSDSGFTFDFYLGRTPPYMPINGSVFKRDMIREHGIDLHFDDLDYGNQESARLFDEDDFARRRLIRMPKNLEKAKKHGW